MAKFKKYEFDSKQQAELFIDDLGFDTIEGIKYPTHNNDIVKLGRLIIIQGVYDDDGNEITPPVISDKYSVDVLWHGQKDKDWKDFRIKLNGKQNSHTFMGWEYSDNTE